MKSFVGSALIVLMALSPLFAEDLKRIGLDDVSTLGTRIETDTKVKVEGSHE